MSVRQVALADTVLVTKLDLIPDADREARRDALGRSLRALNRTAGLAFSDARDFDPAALLSRMGFGPTAAGEAAGAWIEAAADAEGPAGHEHGHGHAHDHTSISSFTLVRDEPVTREALALLLASLERSLGPSLLRVKGLVHVAEEPDRPAVVQGAQHLLHNLDWLAAWPDEDRRTRIVFITQDLPAEDLKAMVDLLDRVAQRTAAARARGRESAAQA